MSSPFKFSHPDDEEDFGGNYFWRPEDDIPTRKQLMEEQLGERAEDLEHDDDDDYYFDMDWCKQS